MIKITNATYLKDWMIKIDFSDNSYAEIDFSYLLSKNTPLTDMLKDEEYFKSFYIDCGAICWDNSLELDPLVLHDRAEKSGVLKKSKIAV